MKSKPEMSRSVSVGRRRFLCAAAGVCAVPRLAFSLMQLAPDMSRSLTKEERDSMTPSQVIDELKKGNERFRSAKMAPRDYLGEKRSSAAGQYPGAVVLGCLDSRVSSKNSTYVDAVARTNVLLGLAEIRRRSPILDEMEKKGAIKIAGAMYDLTNGVVEFLG